MNDDQVLAFRAFLSERCVSTSSARVRPRELFFEFKEWCDKSKMSAVPRKDFEDWLRKCGFRKTVNWLGLGLRYMGIQS